MERLKITAISLLITIMTFEFGPLVLSALLYYAYTYCANRPEEEFEIKPIKPIKPIPSLYIYAFFSLPFVIFYISKQLGIQNDVIEILKYIFDLKLIELYSFDYSVKDIGYRDNLMLFSTSHILSIFTVFLFSNHMAKYRAEKNMGLNRILTFNGNAISDGKRIYARVVLFFMSLIFVVVYYFAMPDKDIGKSMFYKNGLFNIIFFPCYIFMNLICFNAKKVKS